MRKTLGFALLNLLVLAAFSDAGRFRGRCSSGGCSGGSCSSSGGCSSGGCSAPNDTYYGGSCSGGSCSVPAADYQWQVVPGADDQVALMLNGQHVGSYNLAGAYYLRRAGAGWDMTRCASPIALSAEFQARVQGQCPIDGCDCGCHEGEKCRCHGTLTPIPEALNFGLMREEIPCSAPNSLGGIKVSKGVLLQAIGAGNVEVPSDGQMLRVTLIGTETECADATRKLAAVDAANGKYLLQSYRPGEWPVAQSFKTTGHPEIYFQRADGEVIGRWDSTEGKDVAYALTTAVRRADPSYDPRLDPDLAKPAPPPAPVIRVAAPYVAQPATASATPSDDDETELAAFGCLGVLAIGGVVVAGRKKK